MDAENKKQKQKKNKKTKKKNNNNNNKKKKKKKKAKKNKNNNNNKNKTTAKLPRGRQSGGHARNAIRQVSPGNRPHRNLLAMLLGTT